MDESIYDRVVDGLHKRRELVTTELKRKFKKTNPFRMEPISNEELLYSYNQLTPEKMTELIQTYGRDEVNNLIYTMETLKQKNEQRRLK